MSLGNTLHLANADPTMQMLTRLGAGFLDLIYPPRCVGCERGITAEEQPLCSPCMADLERVDPLELRRHVLANVPTFPATTLFALWVFDKGGALQRAQHLLKYGQRPAFGMRLGLVLAAGWQAFASEAPDLVVPVPLHRARLYERGYNQSASLAAGMSAGLRRPHREDLLLRRSATRRQTGLSRQARQQNVSGAFHAEPGAVNGLHLLLLDDVITTGATAAAAIHTLLTAGARRVDFAALAHARR